MFFKVKRTPAAFLISLFYAFIAPESIMVSIITMLSSLVGGATLFWGSLLTYAFGQLVCDAHSICKADTEPHTLSVKSAPLSSEEKENEEQLQALISALQSKSK